MYQRESYLQDITRFLSRLKYEVEFRSSINLYDINIHAEYFYRDFLNLLYGLKLENLNVLKKNAANIDLIDEANKRAIQVTSQNDNGKIKGAIEGFFDEPENSKYELKVLLIAKSAKEYRTNFTGGGKYKFDHRKDVLDLERLLAEIRNKSTEELSVIAKFLAAEEIKFPQISPISELPLIPRLIPANFPKPPPYFTGRRNVLEKIAESLQLYGKASLCGISGIGKSSVVYQYVKENSEKYRHILFVRADRLGFQTNLETVCQEMHLTFDIADDEDSKADKFCRKIQELCEKTEKEKLVLLIFDNVDEVPKLKKFLPESKNLHILLTSNFNEIHNSGNFVEIDSLSNKEAVTLIYRRSRQTQKVLFKDLQFGEKKSIVKIIRAFGFHPLAINVAGAYICEGKKSFSEYWQIFQEDDGKIFEDVDINDSYQKKSIGKAFNIAYKAINTNKAKSLDKRITTQMTRNFLKIASIISPIAMPEELFQETLVLINKETEKIVGNLRKWTDFTKRFYAYSFFDRNTFSRTFVTHDMVKRFLLYKLKEEISDILVPLAAVLDKYFLQFDFDEKKAEIEKYLLHVGSFLEYLEERTEKTSTLKLYNAATLSLCRKYGRYSELYGQYNKAEKYYLFCKLIVEKDNGINEKVIISIYDDLAEISRKKGKFELAKSFLNRAVEIQAEISDEPFTDTAKRQNSLAKLSYSQGNYKEAEILFKKTQELLEQNLDKFHPDLATNYNDLGSVYYVQKKYDSAKELYLKALKIRERILDKYHPDLATTYNDLGNIFNSLTNFEESERYYLKAMKIYERTLGYNHPNTATIYNNLAELYQKQGKIELAEEYYQKSLEISEQSLGHRHPDTAITYWQLGEFYFSLGKFSVSKEWLIKAINVFENVLGKDNADTLGAKQSLSKVEREMRKMF